MAQQRPQPRKQRGTTPRRTRIAQPVYVIPHHEPRRNKRLEMARVVHDVLAAMTPQYECPTTGDLLDAILGSSRLDMAEWANTKGKTRAELERMIWTQELLGFHRDYKERGHRIIVWTGSHWIHMPGKLYLKTRGPETPDSELRRKEINAQLGGVVKYSDKKRRGLVRQIDGVKTVIKQVNEGEVFEQPELLSEDTAD